MRRHNKPKRALTWGSQWVERPMSERCAEIKLPSEASSASSMLCVAKAKNCRCARDHLVSVLPVPCDEKATRTGRARTGRARNGRARTGRARTGTGGPTLSLSLTRGGHVPCDEKDTRTFSTHAHSRLPCCCPAVATTGECRVGLSQQESAPSGSSVPYRPPQNCPSDTGMWVI